MIGKTEFYKLICSANKIWSVLISLGLVDNRRLIDGNELYYIKNDRSQENNVITKHPEVAARLAEGYKRWWQSFMDDNVDDK